MKSVFLGWKKTTAWRIGPQDTSEHVDVFFFPDPMIVIRVFFCYHFHQVTNMSLIFTYICKMFFSYVTFFFNY